MIDPIALSVLKDFLQEKCDPEWIAAYYPENEEDFPEFLYERVRYGLKPSLCELFGQSTLSSVRKLVFKVDDEFVEVAVQKNKADNSYSIFNVYYVKPVQHQVTVTEYEHEHSSKRLFELIPDSFYCTPDVGNPEECLGR